ncbi:MULTISPECIES: purple acid phosphatase family protein [Paenibacillus]|uniref:purple acid phosphatase family protein n=1 Tax=Paenibacillus TaxID=44249 RepID=UPI0022B88ADF|nr:metallophosphoesterase family protein [Paenibacillus caseinilyticus]MCZ8522069.1 metallophosphoesterase family protein [Paenibacillus caseinilyticus]
MKRYRDWLWLAGTGLLLAAVWIGIEWRKAGGEENGSLPKSIVTTVSGDARTSRGFAWYTADRDGAAVVRIAEGAEEDALQSSTARSITGVTLPVKTSDGETQGSHQVNVTGLKPGTTYTYRVGSGAEGSWSESASFTTEADGAEKVTFLNVTDSQGVTEADFAVWGQTLDRAFSLFPDARFIVHNGDLTEDPGDEAAWDQFFGKAQRWMRRVPLMPVTGNHDEIDGGAERLLPHFVLPANGADGPAPGTNYSFDYGAVHIAVLNTESKTDRQTAWLRRDLAATDKPWKIVAMHRGAYGGNTYKKAQQWVPVLDEFQVDLVLQGHNHEYSRSYPLRGGKVTGSADEPVVDRAGTVYVVTNASGTKFNEKKDDQFYHAVHFQNGKPMFAGITISGDTLTYQAYDIDGKKLDEAVLRHQDKRASSFKDDARLWDR